MDVAVAEPRQQRTLQEVIHLVKGDITELEVDAFVFYARHDLALGSGIGGAISVRGGLSVQKELSVLAPAGTGDAVLTAAGNLRARHIIHAVGPRFLEADTEGKLRTTVWNCLERAAEQGLRRVAFPLMGAGYYGIPAPVSARVMLGAFADHPALGGVIDEIVVCALDTPQLEAFRSALDATAEVGTTGS